jgi:hypothetical protein
MLPYPFSTQIVTPRTCLRASPAGPQTMATRREKETSSGSMRERIVTALNVAGRSASGRLLRVEATRTKLSALRGSFTTGPSPRAGVSSASPLLPQRWCLADGYRRVRASSTPASEASRPRAFRFQSRRRALRLPTRLADEVTWLRWLGFVAKSLSAAKSMNTRSFGGTDSRVGQTRWQATSEATASRSTGTKAPLASSSRVRISSI